jgi:hypothetical protein
VCTNFCDGRTGQKLYVSHISTEHKNIIAAVVQLRFEATSLNGQVGKNVNVDP